MILLTILPQYFSYYCLLNSSPVGTKSFVEIWIKRGVMHHIQYALQKEKLLIFNVERNAFIYLFLPKEPAWSPKIKTKKGKKNTVKVTQPKVYISINVSK